MRKIISLLLALLFVASCQKTGSCPNPPKKANNTFKVEFKATPQQFSAQGGQGTPLMEISITSLLKKSG